MHFFYRSKRAISLFYLPPSPHSHFPIQNGGRPSNGNPPEPQIFKVRNQREGTIKREAGTITGKGGGGGCHVKRSGAHNSSGRRRATSSHAQALARNERNHGRGCAVGRRGGRVPQRAGTIRARDEKAAGRWVARACVRAIERATKDRIIRLRRRCERTNERASERTGEREG